MASRKHAKQPTPAATTRPATEPTTTAPATSAAAPTTRPRSNRTPATNTQAESTTPTTATTSSRPPAPATAPRTQPATNAASASAKPSEATTSSGNNSSETSDDSDKKVVLISNKSEFDKYLDEAGNKLVLVEFFATWCGPCRLLSPKLEQLAIDYADKVFVMKMDVDECEEVPMEYGVSSMPTFLFLRNKKKLELFVGSNSDKLIKRLERLCDPSRSLTSLVPPSAPSAPSTHQVADPAKKKVKSYDETEQSTPTAPKPTTSTGKKTAAK